MEETETKETDNKIVFKNEIFERNVTDPNNGKIVKSIYVHNWTKLARDHWMMVWQYYRDRNRRSVEEIYEKYKDTQIRIIYKGEPMPVFVGEKKEKPEPKVRNKENTIKKKQLKMEARQEQSIRDKEKYMKEMIDKGIDIK